MLQVVKIAYNLWRGVHISSYVDGKNITIGKGTKLTNHGLYINTINGVVLGDNVYFGPGVKIISANHKLHNVKEHTKTREIRIGNNTWLEADCIILPGVHIGNNCIIGAGAIVSRDVPDDSLVVGNRETTVLRYR